MKKEHATLIRKHVLDQVMSEVLRKYRDEILKGAKKKIKALNEQDIIQILQQKGINIESTEKEASL